LGQSVPLRAARGARCRGTWRPERCKSLLAMAVAAALPAVATAQVEIWGVLDTGYQSAKQGSVKKNNTTSSGLTSSQLGFRGVEKIGNDMHAGFWFESQVWGDAPQAVIFSRRQTLDFGGAWGAIRLGRDYTPTFWNHTVFDPYGTLGSGAGSNITGVGPNAVTFARTNNGISYLYGYAPNSASATGSGIYVQATYAPGEVQTPLAAGKAQGSQYTGVRVGYREGPINVAFATANIQTDTAGKKDSEWNIGGSYSLPVATIMAKFGKAKCTVAANGSSCGAAGNTSFIAPAEYTWWSIGASVPVGANSVRLSYNAGDNNVNGQEGTQLALGYVHNFSKRTAAYATYARINNNATGLYTFNGGNGGFGPGFGAAKANIEGKDGTAFDIGIRHSF